MNADLYLPTYAENVFPAGRKALITGKFHDMFMAGDGHELEDYADKNGGLHIAHARAINSSSMLAYNFFHWVSPEHPLKLYGNTFDKVFFEVKFPVMAKTSEGRPINRPSNMDVVLISDDCSTMLCIESKYTEHTHNQQAIFSDAYFKPACYYEGNPYRTEFIKLALRYNEESNGYYAGIKQNISHLIGLTNIMHDADALAWFKANNPFIEPEVMSRLSAHTAIIFTNLLYTRPEKEGRTQDIEDATKAYQSLLCELWWDQLEEVLDEPLLLSRFIVTYPELFNEVASQMPKALSDYLDNRYVLTVPPQFPLPDGYDTADHYLTDLVLKGANERYQESFTPEVTERIKSELAVIRHRGWADRFLIAWDCVREAHQRGFVTGPGRNRSAGSVVTYCLGITDVEPLSAGLSAEGLLLRASLPDFTPEFSGKGKEFAMNYLSGQYGVETAAKMPVQDYSVLDMAEQVIDVAGKDLDFRAIPYSSPELLQFFLSDPDWRDYSYFGQQDMDALRAIESPTVEDMVRIFRIRSFSEDSTQVVSREHSYARCVLFLRLAWLKMHYPELFQQAINKVPYNKMVR